jgi:hypothetical protein
MQGNQLDTGDLAPSDGTGMNVRIPAGCYLYGLLPLCKRNFRTA